MTFGCGFWALRRQALLRDLPRHGSASAFRRQLFLDQAGARERERSARRQGKPRGSRLDAHEAFVVATIEANKDVTLNEMVERLTAERSVCIGRSALRAWLHGRD